MFHESTGQAAALYQATWIRQAGAEVVLVAPMPASIVPRESNAHREATGKLFFQTQAIASILPSALPMGKADNQILGVVREMQDQHPDKMVVLVSKDINMRIKARTMGLPAEDYFNDQVLEDTDLLYTGVLQLPDDFWDRHGKGVESWQQGGHTYYRVTGPLVSSLVRNRPRGGQSRLGSYVSSTR